MFCESCGSEMPDGARFCPSCGHNAGEKVKRASEHPVEDKNMILALVISFLLTGLGIAYAGDKRKGIIFFAAGIILAVLGMMIPLLALAGILLWAYALYATYKQVRIANGQANPNLIEDMRGFPTNKKIAAIIIIAVILLFVIGGVIGALMPSHDVSSDYDYDTYESPDDSVSSGGSSDSIDYSSSSSSDGYDTHSHYEGEYGSSDTYGSVNDDGSVDAYQKGTTDYGDYEINSHMDSEGNIHGTVDVGGKTYYVDT